ncbi:hypothetical protein OMF49_17650, partial [Bordetella pertussis]
DVGGETWDIAIEPGPRARVASVDLKFTGRVARPEYAARIQKWRDDWALKAGQPFINGDWNKAKSGLLDAVSTRDFLLAHMTHSLAEVDAETAQVRLSVEIDSGPAVRMGAYAGLGAEKLDGIAEVWRGAGFNAQAVDNLPAMQWEKLICNVAYSAPCTLTGLTIGEVLDAPHASAVSQAAATEAWNVARALGVPVAVEDPVAHVRAFGERIRGAKPSVMLDHEQRRVSEIDYINGAIPRQAARAGIQAPVNQTLTALVKQREEAWK